MEQSYSFINSNSRGTTTDRVGNRVAQIASSIIILVGCSVLIGWQLDLWWLKSLMPGVGTMKANTAICFVLAGISLKLSSRQQQTALMARIATGCAIAIILIAFLTICQYIFGWDFGIDELLFRDPAAVATSHPGRMGINTTIGLAFIGAALWLIGRQDRRSPNRPQHQVKIDRTTIAQILTVVAGAISLQSIVGYAYDVRVFYQFSVVTTSMALHTALSLGILCVGILALTRERGFMRALTSDLIGGEVARRLIPQAILVPLLIGWLILRGLQANLYDPNFAFSLMSLSMVAISLGLIRQNAGILNRVDYDRIRSDDRIRSNEERLKLALEGAKQGIWEFDLQTQVLTWDDRCKEMFGLSPDTLVTVGGHVDAIHPDDRQRVSTAADLAISNCDEFSQEYRTIHSDGTISWILTKGHCYCNGAGEAWRMSGTMMDITDLKQAQTKVEQQLGEIEAIYRSTPIGLSYISSDLKFIRINEQLAQINGLSVPEHIGRTIREVLPEMADTIESIYRQVIESREPILALELSGSTSAQPGENRCWLASYHPHQDTQGRVMAVSAVVQEITARKHQEVERERQAAALRASEQKFSAIFNNTFGLIGLFDLNGVVLDVNQAALASIVGVASPTENSQPSDIVGKKCWETPWWTHSPQLQYKLRKSIAQAASGQFVRYEVEFPNPSGGVMTTDFSLKPVFDENRVVTIVAEGRDITALKQVEAELRESEERFHTLADNISQLAWMADASGWIFWYNRRWFDYTGTTLEEMQGWGWEQVHHPEHLDRVAAHFRHHLEIGEEWEDTFPLRGRDGTYRWFLSRAIPIVDETGQVLRWFGTNTDITDLKQAQADLQARHQELDSFAYIVSHDLKAPLRAVSNLSQWSEEDLEGVLTKDTQAQMTLLRSRVDRMRATIDGLLDYARIGRTEGKSEPVVGSELLLEVIDSLAPPPTFSIEIDPNLPTLNTNRVLLFQVFANLIGNGIKHHDRVDGSIQISGRECGDLYEFIIADDGPGIPPEYQANIFTIFQTGNSRTTDSTGIGLAIVKKIVESEGGTIRLESAIDLGTTFYFTWAK